MRPIAVFDIDGVLADVQHRVHHVQSRPKDYRAFFAAAHADPLLSTGADLVRVQAERHDIRYLTGRPERLRATTEQWLADHQLPAGVLAMRRERDYRPARVFKREQLQAWLAQGLDVALVVDDDPKVIAAVDDLGPAVLLADWQPAAKSEQLDLWEVQEKEGRS